MKKLMLLALFVAVVSGKLPAQGTRHAPPAVQRSFQKDYPEARNPQWSSNKNEWHASFDDHSRYDRGEMVAHYDRNGHHIDSHIPYDRNDVPQPVVDRTQRNYPGGRDYTYTRIERPAGRPLFQVSLNLQNKSRTLYVDDKGKEQNYHDRH